VGVGGFSVIVVVWWVVSGFMVVLTRSDVGVLILVGVERSCGGVGGMMGGLFWGWMCWCACLDASVDVGGHVVVGV
jgi:hypothetical protein